MITIERTGARIYLRGDTYPHKDAIRRVGGHWDAESKAWWVGAAKSAAADSLVASLNAAPPPQLKVAGKCDKCGKSCKPQYTRCYTCSTAAAGKCAGCREPLSQWERERGVRRCADCRDGGSRAHGGQSYTDRHGRFVLGDDD